MKKLKNDNYEMSFGELTYMLEIYQEVCMSEAIRQLKELDYEPRHYSLCMPNVAQFVHSYVTDVEQTKIDWLTAASNGSCLKLAADIERRRISNDKENLFNQRRKNDK